MAAQAASGGNGYSLVARALKAAGIKHMFGVIGIPVTELASAAQVLHQLWHAWGPMRSCRPHLASELASTSLRQCMRVLSRPTEPQSQAVALSVGGQSLLWQPLIANRLGQAHRADLKHGG